MLSLYFCLLALLCIFGAHRIHTLVRYWKSTDQSLQHQDSFCPTVTVQLPVFNEFNVVERLLEAVCALQWPSDKLSIQILDDSTDETSALLQQLVDLHAQKGIDVCLLHRTHRTGYKAGALAAGLPQAKGDFIAIFDADFIPRTDFLLRTLPYFSDNSVGMVQARWEHLNRHHSLLTEISAVMLDGHFVLEHSARYHNDLFFNFNGTAGVWRKSCINDAGGWSSDTITEDLDISYRAQLLGWRFIYLKNYVVPAEVPANMQAFLAQQFRWAKGAIQVAQKMLRPIWASSFRWEIKWEASMHFLCHLAHPLTLLLVLLLPYAAHLRQQQELFLAGSIDLAAFVFATLSVFAFYICAEYEAGHSRRWWRFPLVLALGIGLTINQSRAVLLGLFSHDTTFVRTPKDGHLQAKKYRLHNHSFGLPEMLFGLYTSASGLWLFAQGCWFPIPFLLLFSAGYFYVGGLIFWERCSPFSASCAEKKNDPAICSDPG